MRQFRYGSKIYFASRRERDHWSYYSGTLVLRTDTTFTVDNVRQHICHQLNAYRVVGNNQIFSFENYKLLNI